MKAFLAILIVGVCCVALTQGLFFKKKVSKDGCDPNPCKNSATCVKDARNPNISTCVCVGEYHGKHCELKTGCYSKPCRRGTCMNDKVDPSKYHCKCNGTFVGTKCDIADACAKSPCKNGGACSLDEKYKPVCACKLGFGDKYCSARNCTITTFKGKQFTKSSPKVYVDQSIEAKMKNLDELAHLCKIRLHVLKSFVLHHDPKQAHQLDVKDKTNPGHYIGQAVSFHIYDQEDKLLCNDICLGKLPIPQAGAKCFIDGLHAINWKWSILDPTVVSTNYHLGNTVGYNKLREFHQVGCKEKKFSN